jgi:hypothetical protein
MIVEFAVGGSKAARPLIGEATGKLACLPPASGTAVSFQPLRGR